MASNRFVRSSKYRHIAGTAEKRDKCYDGIRITKSPHESNMCDVNSKFVAVVMEGQGGGPFFVAPLSRVGRFDTNYPKVNGHKNPVLDIKWNPFNANQLASASEDMDVKIWTIPDEGLKENLSESTKTLSGHGKKVMHLAWHPSAENILLSADGEGTVILWNVEKEEIINKMTNLTTELIYSISWNYNGSHFAMTSKDKKIRVVNPRTGDVEMEGKSHDGNKPCKVVFCGETNKLFTTGFSRMSERQYALWDSRELSKPLCMENIDSSSGVQFPVWDEGTRVVYLVGKGDTVIRYFEVTDDSPYVFFLTMFQGKGSEPHRGAGYMPKRHLDYMKCETMRFYRLLNKNIVEPLVMKVPRKSEQFQADIFPPTFASTPALTADQWISGTNKDPVLAEFLSDGSGIKELSVEDSQKGYSYSGGGSSKKSGQTKSTGPTTLSEYKQAYKALKEENEKLKMRIQELEQQ